MRKRIKEFSESDLFRIILVVIGSIISTTVLTLAILAILHIQAGDVYGSSHYLLGIFFVLGFSRLVTLSKERTKQAFLRFLTLFLFDIALGITIFYGKDNPYLFSICGGLYCLTIVVNQMFKLIQKHKVRNIIVSALVILGAILLAIGLFIPSSNGVGDTILIISLVIAISAFVEVFSNATSQLKLKILFKIIIKTYAFEILLGLLTMMVASSLIFYLYEPGVYTFGDGMWLSFAIVTTIGFGDINATSLVGRLISVILGIYGILVVAVITSIIVNFYNETAGKTDKKHLKDVDKD